MTYCSYDFENASVSTDFTASKSSEQVQVGLPGEKHLTNFKIELYMKCIKPHEKISGPAFISFSIMTQAIGMSITWKKKDDLTFK